MPLEILERSVERGRLHHPKEAGPHPGLVLIHDVWGLSEHSRALAADWAREGFAVLEIDLYRSLGAIEIEEVGAHIRSLDDRQILADLEAGADWLAAEVGEVAAGGIGLTGVCMGGTFAILAACATDRFAAVAPFYGILSYDEGLLAPPEGGSGDRDRKPLSPIEAAASLRVPLYASFGLEDGFVPEAHLDRLEAGFAQSAQAFTIDRHGGAGHAFLNRTRAEAFHAEATARAWAQVVPFLRARLGGGARP